jgi:hypothetical protein
MHFQGIKIVPGETTTPTGKNAVRDVECPRCQSKYHLCASPGMPDVAVELQASALRKRIESQPCGAHTGIIPLSD